MGRSLVMALVLGAATLLGSARAQAQDEPVADPAAEAPAAPDHDTSPEQVSADEAEGDPEAASDPEADPVSEDEPTPTPAEPEGTEPSAEEPEASVDALGPKVAVVLVGDPDPAMQALARRVDRVLERTLRRPFDPGLRASLRGAEGSRGDGLAEVRRERRRLGLGESADAPILSTLGRRAGADAVVVLRLGDDGAELVVLDVRNAAFFEGHLTVAPDTSERRIQRFVTRRARISSRGAHAGGGPAPVDPEAAAEAAVAASTQADEEPAAEPDFFEQFWPYGVAALLLGGMITAIVLASTSDGAPQPVLRFVPGGR